MDITIAERFVQEYPNFQNCLIQVFDDVETRKDKKLAREALRRWPSTVEQLVELNKQWCGVFFSVNSIKWNKRRQANVNWINARVVEVDHLSKEEQVKLMELAPLEPSLSVESKRSFHFYWFAKDWTKENWRKIMRWVRNFFWWDHKIITEERVLRIPWFDHCKDLDDKFETTYRPWSNKHYTEEQMLKAFPNTTNKKEQEKKLKSFMNSDDFRTRAKSVNCEHMLQLLSWSKWVNGESIEVRNNQIYINWLSTSSWIDKDWFIGSHDNWWPYWTNWISWYGTVDRKELYEWTIDKLPHLKQDKLSPKETKKEVTKEVTGDDFLVEYDRDFKIDTQTIVPFTWGSIYLDDYFWRLEKGRFMTTIWESGSGKTTRAFNQAIEISRNYKTLFISLEMTAERVIELRARKMSWITNSERNDKNIPDAKLKYMEQKKKEITDNKMLEIVWVNRKAEIIHIDLVLNSIRKKYMDYEWIVIDNLWFIRSDEWEMYKELNTIVRKTKDFCHQENKNINLLHHFNKGKGNRKDRTFADVLGTGKLEHDVDYGVFISRHLEDRENLTEEEKQQVFIKCTKNRDTGETKKGILYFHKWWYHDEWQRS